MLRHVSSHLLLHQVAQRASRYLEDLETRRVAPTAGALTRLAELESDFGDAPMDPSAILALLDDIGSPATVASAGPRYFGFVIGGSLPAALAANWATTETDVDRSLAAILRAAAAPSAGTMSMESSAA